jgi:DNA-binding NtrC family response regulator
VLLVEAEEDLRRTLSKWLTEAGFDVKSCAGPHLAAPACPFEATGPCDLVRAADVVVLDGWLESDTLMQGPTSWELALAYRALGLPIVVLGRRADPIRFEGEAGVVVLERPPDRATLVGAVEGLAIESERSTEDWIMDARPSSLGDRELR